ncbi:MAG: hypothetical protein ABEI27_11520 [Halobellus sp.]|uniref:DUF7313 family protein n=1 Tax=Halobellus sp. TaxID=1979212 RepID=UPI0035D4D29C
MQPLQFLVPIDALEAVGGILPIAVFVLVILNMITRILQHNRHNRQLRDGDGEEAITRWLPHTLTNLGMVLLSFVYMIVAPHGGMVLSVLVVTVFIADFFGFESRKVEARSKSKDLTQPIPAVGASVFALLYAGYQSFFYVIEPLWNVII